MGYFLMSKISSKISNLDCKGGREPPTFRVCQTASFRILPIPHIPLDQRLADEIRVRHYFESFHFCGCKMREMKLLLIACYIVLLISPARLRAQTVVTSTILGTVTDPQGAAVAGAQVRLLDVDTGRERTAVSGQDGNYVFPDLNAGRYEVEVSNPGFKLTRSQAVTIGAAGTTQRINIALALAGVSQQVAVTAAQVELVHTDDANLNVALTAEAVRDIPVQGRNFLNYAQLAPLFNSGNGQLNWG